MKYKGQVQIAWHPNYKLSCRRAQLAAFRTTSGHQSTEGSGRWNAAHTHPDKIKKVAGEGGFKEGRQRAWRLSITSSTYAWAWYIDRLIHVGCDGVRTNIGKNVLNKKLGRGESVTRNLHMCRENMTYIQEYSAEEILEYDLAVGRSWTERWWESRGGSQGTPSEVEGNIPRFPSESRCNLRRQPKTPQLIVRNPNIKNK